MSDRPSQTDALPFLLFQRGGAFNIKGRGTLVGGLASQEARASVGDVIEARQGDKTVFRTTILEVIYLMGSPPPPGGNDRLALMVNPDDVGDIRDDLEVWVVTRNDSAD